MTPRDAAGAREVIPDLLPRIEQASREERDARDRAGLLARARDALIVQAVDSGITSQAVASAAGLSRSRIVGILSRSDDEGGYLE